jgi:DNA-binding response OmpR family regulator
MSKKILVVDDEPEVVELLSFTLTQAGFSVETAANGIEALRQARTTHPDLIVLDLMMPELDGFTVCEVLRRDPATAAIPILILTAASSGLARLGGRDVGATDYITKPFSLKQLVSRAHDLLVRVPKLT